MTQNLEQELKNALARQPRIALGCWPTPLMELTGMERRFGGSRVYCKRDDLSGIGSGGNKIRCMEFLLGDAAAVGADLVIAAGSVQSNLCTLAAASCIRAGMRCRCYINGEAPEKCGGNALLNELMGAELVYMGDMHFTAREERVSLEIEALKKQGLKPYRIVNGASTGVGALGYVDAALEISMQCRQQGIENMTVFVPGGNGGVAAGLIFGAARLGFPFRVRVISVEDDKETLLANIGRITDEISGLLGLELPAPLRDCCEADDSFRGGGWSVNTPESEKMVRDFAAAEGIFIENIYTAKVVVGMESRLRSGALKGPACYLHTGGFGSLFAQY